VVVVGLASWSTQIVPAQCIVTLSTHGLDDAQFAEVDARGGRAGRRRDDPQVTS